MCSKGTTCVYPNELQRFGDENENFLAALRLVTRKLGIALRVFAPLELAPHELRYLLRSLFFPAMKVPQIRPEAQSFVSLCRELTERLMQQDNFARRIRHHYDAGNDYKKEVLMSMVDHFVEEMVAIAFRNFQHVG